MTHLLFSVLRLTLHSISNTQRFLIYLIYDDDDDDDDDDRKLWSASS